MNENTQAERRPLEEGSRVGEYRIVRCLGSNGEGIFYLAQDCIVGDVVQLQEFFPAGIACRCDDADALQPLAGHATEFKYFRASFQDLYRILQQEKENSCLIPIVQLFEQNASICKSAPLRRHSDNQADVNAGAVQKNTCCRCTTAFLPCIKKESPIRASARKISCWMKKTAFTGADFLCWRCALRPERWSRSCLPDTAHRSNTSRKAGAAAGPTCTRSQR